MSVNPNSAMRDDLRAEHDYIALLRNARVDVQPRDGSPRSDGANTDESTEGQMPATTVPAVHFSSADKELLDSGKYADAKIIANGKTYAVHKSVLCTRSKWFRRAFEGRFRGGQDGVVEISAPEDIERVLEFLYTGAVDLSNDDDLMTAANELAVLGDFYLIDEMKTYIAQVLGQYLGEYLKSTSDVGSVRAVPAEYATAKYWAWIQDKSSFLSDGTAVRHLHNFRFLLENGFVNRLCVAIRNAYATPSGIHRVYVDFVCASQACTFSNPSIQALREEIPEFGRDILTALMTGPQSSAFEGNTAFEQWKDGATTPLAPFKVARSRPLGPKRLPLVNSSMYPAADADLVADLRVIRQYARSSD